MTFIVGLIALLVILGVFAGYVYSTAWVANRFFETGPIYEAKNNRGLYYYEGPAESWIFWTLGTIMATCIGILVLTIVGLIIMALGSALAGWL